MQVIDNLNTDDLMKLQVQQLEKEKKDLNERLRIIHKRLDHTERAYRKEERPLLDKDYEQQQKDDQTSFETNQKALLEGTKAAHEQDLLTKKRLARMMQDFRERHEVYAGKRGDEYTKKKEAATRKIEEEKSKRRKAVLQAREEERKRIEDEERIAREQEEEELRLEEGLWTWLIYISDIDLTTTFRTHRRREASYGRGRSSESC